MRMELQTETENSFSQLLSPHSHHHHPQHTKTRLLWTLLVQMTRVAPLSLKDMGQVHELDPGAHASFYQRSDKGRGVGWVLSRAPKAWEIKVGEEDMIIHPFGPSGAAGESQIGGVGVGGG